MKKQKEEKLSIMNNNIKISDINSGNNLINKNNLIVNNHHNKHNKIEKFDNNLSKNNLTYSYKNSKEIFYKRTNKNKLDSINDEEKDFIINKINLKETLFSICSCFKRKRNVYKLLLDETMSVIMEKLDIFNLFRDLCSIETSKDDCNSRIIKMSKECSNHLKHI